MSRHSAKALSCPPSSLRLLSLPCPYLSTSAAPHTIAQLSQNKADTSSCVSRSNYGDGVHQGREDWNARSQGELRPATRSSPLGVDINRVSRQPTEPSIATPLCLTLSVAATCEIIPVLRDRRAVRRPGRARRGRRPEREAKPVLPAHPGRAGADPAPPLRQISAVVVFLVVRSAFQSAAVSHTTGQRQGQCGARPGWRGMEGGRA